MTYPIGLGHIQFSDVKENQVELGTGVVREAVDHTNEHRMETVGYRILPALFTAARAIPVVLDKNPPVNDTPGQDELDDIPGSNP